MSKRLQACLIGVVMVVVFGWVWWQNALSPLLVARQTRGWPEVSCRILSSEVKSQPGSSGARDDYFAVVRYEYDYDGRTRTSARLAPGDSTVPFDSMQEAEQTAQRYPAGSERKCYVDPKDPAVAVLERVDNAKVRWEALLMFFVPVGIGLLLLVAAAVNKVR